MIDEGETGLSRDPFVGIRVQEFLLVRRLGQGGFGAVYLALQLPVMMKTAVKLLRTIGEEDDDLAMGRQTFESEARAMGRLHHPNIVRLNRYGLVGNTPYLAMEFVRGGRELKDLIAERRGTGFSHAEILHLISQLLRALSAAHEENVIHRDIKPGNMMVQKVKGDPLFLRVLDFGLVKFFSESPETTMARGTPLYMAPEQLRGRNIGPWTDVYATGLILYELLTGSVPFLFEPRDLLYSYKLDPSYSVVQEAAAADLSEPLREVIYRATRVESEERFQSADAFHDAIVAAFGGRVTQQQTVPMVSGEEVTVSVAIDKARAAEIPKPAKEEEGEGSFRASTTMGSRFLAVFRGRRRARRILLAFAIVALLATAGLVIWDQVSAGGEIRVSDVTAADQQEPALARLSGGILVAAWDSNHPEAERKDVFLRTLGSDGTPSGDPIRVNTTVEGDQEMPELAALAGGGLVVIWTSWGQDGDSWGLFGQIFDPSLGRTSDEFPVNLTWTRGEQSEAAIAALPGGDFVVAWQSRDADGDDFGVVTQRFSSSAERVGPERVINEIKEGPQRYPGAAALPDGGFVVTWESARTGEDENCGVLLRVFDDGGEPRTAEIPVNTTTVGRQRWPEIAVLGADRIVVAWSSEGQDGDMFGAYARFFDADGTPASGEVRLNDLATGNQYLTQFAVFDDRTFVGIWASDEKDGSGLGVVGAVFNSEGRRVRPEAILNRYTQSDQVIRSVLAMDGHRYLAAWQSKGQDGDGQGVYVRLVDADSEE